MLPHTAAIMSPRPVSGLIESTDMGAYIRTFEAESLCAVGVWLSEVRLIYKFKLGKSPLYSKAVSSESATHPGFGS